MPEKDILDTLKNPENLRYQVGRLISNEESEKEVRKRRNELIDARLKSLEDDKLARDTTIKTAILVFKLLAWLNLGAIVTFVAALIKLFSNKT